jgi:hypothetical protein
MPAQTVRIGLVIIIGFLAVTPLRGGYYNTTDTGQETAWSPDYEYVFRNVLADLQLIAANPDPIRNPPIRRRYVLMEALGQTGARDWPPGLQTLEQKLDYSAVLIRRGKADEAAQLLAPLTEEHPRNFIVYSQCATAHFLSSTPDFRPKAKDYMRDSLKLWPQTWKDVDEDQKKFLESMRWEETAFLRYRRYETYFKRLMENRLDEEKQPRKKKATEETVDPIFVGSDNIPVRFLNEKGEFEVGRIAEAERKKLPPDYIEAVEQLLIWKPGDDRLLWLLGEVLNASAMDQKEGSARNQAIRNAFEVFKQLRTDVFNGQPISARETIRKRYEALEPHVKPAFILEDPNLIPVRDAPLEKGNPTSLLSNEIWWRALSVGFVTGFAVGMFALWQFQEGRRRRQARMSG